MSEHDTTATGNDNEPLDDVEMTNAAEHIDPTEDGVDDHETVDSDTTVDADNSDHADGDEDDGTTTDASPADALTFSIVFDDDIDADTSLPDDQGPVNGEDWSDDWTDDWNSASPEVESATDAEGDGSAETADDADASQDDDTVVPAVDETIVQAATRHVDAVYDAAATTSDDAVADSNTTTDDTDDTHNAGSAVASAANTASSHIDRKLRGRDDLSLLKVYPTFSMQDVTVSNPKTGRDTLDHITMACYDGATHALLVDRNDTECHTTLMQVVSGLRLPTSGTVRYRSADLHELEPITARGHRLGIVPQRYAVRGDLTPIDNLVMAMDASNRSFIKPKRTLARELLERVGFTTDDIDTFAHTLTRDLSDVEQRRVALARALSCDAEVIIADEPTAGLNPADAAAIQNLLLSLADAASKRCVIIVTCDEHIADACNDVTELY